MTILFKNIQTAIEGICDKLTSLQFDLKHKYHSCNEHFDLLDYKTKLKLEKAKLEAELKNMQSIIGGIQKALEDLEVKDAKLKSDYLDIPQETERAKNLLEQERVIMRRIELETTLKIIAEFEAAL